MNEPAATQTRVARRFGAVAAVPDPHSVCGLALATLSLGGPLHGLRHPAESLSSGWYLWRGELDPANSHFFQPVHHHHLAEAAPEAVPYLGLPPGWRFLVAVGHEDVWQDPTLLDIAPERAG